MLRAIIMDFDGVIADTEPIHFKLFQKVLAEEVIDLKFKDYEEKYLGLDDWACLTAVIENCGREVDPEYLHSLVEKKAELFKATIKNELRFIPGSLAFIKRVATKCPLAIVSGALKKEVVSILRIGEVRRHFPVIVAAEDVEEGKPHPEGYQRSLELLNVNIFSKDWPLQASECVVIEDSHWGIQAAHQAGMHCVALTTTYPKKDLQVADAIFPNLSKISFADLDKIT
jgi:beta-phosphoglucomutase